ncbi:MAG: ABC transporter permease [Lachnospiraceae bacterium]|nr:ABC transporter permease [Lachnospiraceae bacterium]
MRKYVVIYRSVLMENLQYTVNIAMGFISYFFIIFVFINLWDYMYAAPGDLIAGYTKEQMIWYVMITEMIWFGARSTTIRQQVPTDIRGGNIAYLVNKPYWYPLYILAKYTGEWNIQLPMYAVLTTVIGVTMVGAVPNFHPVTLLAAVPCIVLGVTIHGMFKICISMLSFWIEDSNPFQWLYDKLILVVGTIFPVEIFPASLHPILKLTPIYTVCYGPAKLIVDFSVEKYLEILLAQVLYLAIGCGIMCLLYEKGGRKLYVNGG